MPEIRTEKQCITCGGPAVQVVSHEGIESWETIAGKLKLQNEQLNHQVQYMELVAVVAMSMPDWREDYPTVKDAALEWMRTEKPIEWLDQIMMMREAIMQFRNENRLAPILPTVDSPESDIAADLVSKMGQMRATERLSQRRANRSDGRYQEI